MHIHIQEWIHHFGYFGIFLILFFEMVGIPFPAETTLTLSGIEWSQGHLILPYLILSAVLGNVVGSTAAFFIGRYLGRPVIVRFGRFVGITEPKLDAADRTFQKYRSWIVIIGKFIAGIRVLVPYLAGLNNMSFALFSLYNFISAAVWAVTFIVLGKYIGQLWDRYKPFIHQYWIPLTILICLVAAAAFLIKRQRKIKKMSGENSSEAD